MPPKKKVAAIVKVALNAGAATPAPPVGTALGPHGVNIMEFCKAYNAATESQRGNVIPVEITVYEDRSFTFVCKTPPAAELIKKELKLKHGVRVDAAIGVAARAGLREGDVILSVDNTAVVEGGKITYTVTLISEDTKLPADIDYTGISGLSKEIQSKLGITRPETLGQASRIPGVTPAAISLLMIHLKKRGAGRQLEQSA